MTFDLDASDLEKFAAEFSDLPSAMLMQAGIPAMQEAVLVLREFPPYPPKPGPGDWTGFKTDKQRRWFFAALKRGEIDVPYHRTGHLQQSFTENVPTITSKEGEITGAVGTNLDYSPWVVGLRYPGENINGTPMYQASIHQTRWWEFYEEVDRNSARAWDVFEAVFFDNIEKMWQGSPA